MDQTRAAFSNIDRVEAQLKSKLADASEEADTLRRRVQTLEQQAQHPSTPQQQHLDTHSQQHQQHIQQQQHEIELQQKITSLEQDLSSERSKHTVLQKEHAAISNKLVLAAQEVTSLRDMNTTLTAELDSLRQSATSLSSSSHHVIVAPDAKLLVMERANHELESRLREALLNNEKLTASLAASASQSQVILF